MLELVSERSLWVKFKFRLQGLGRSSVTTRGSNPARLGRVRFSCCLPRSRASSVENSAPRPRRTRFSAKSLLNLSSIHRAHDIFCSSCSLVEDASTFSSFMRNRLGAWTRRKEEKKGSSDGRSSCANSQVDKFNYRGADDLAETRRGIFLCFGICHRRGPERPMTLAISSDIRPALLLIN